jgi:4-aminobutyrate aminotransferase
MRRAWVNSCWSACSGWKQSHPAVGDVRGRGLMIGIEIVKDKATREPAVDLRNRVETLAFERGLMVLGCGETSLRLSPPLIVSKEEATVALDILEEALTRSPKRNTSRARCQLQQREGRTHERSHRY